MRLFSYKQQTSKPNNVTRERNPPLEKRSAGPHVEFCIYVLQSVPHSTSTGPNLHTEDLNDLQYLVLRSIYVVLTTVHFFPRSSTCRQDVVDFHALRVCRFEILPILCPIGMNYSPECVIKPSRLGLRPAASANAFRVGDPHHCIYFVYNSAVIS